MKEDKNVRANFRNCSIFTADRSLNSIIDACDFENIQKSPLNILDAFAGHGVVAEAISKYLSSRERPHSITTAEINPNHLNRVPEQYNHLCLDIRKDRIDGNYDIVVIRYGFHDLSYENKEKALRNLVGSLDTNGRIVISDIIPDGQSREWLESHHQQKEILTRGPNKDVTLSSPNDYVNLLEKLGVQAGVEDSFYQEVFMREWVGTYGASEEAISALENLTLQAPLQIKDRFMVFNHPKRGARIYFPVVTIAGVKNV